MGNFSSATNDIWIMDMSGMARTIGPCDDTYPKQRLLQKMIYTLKKSSGCRSAAVMIPIGVA